MVVADGALARDTFVGALEQVPDLGPVGCDLDHGALTACWARWCASDAAVVALTVPRLGETRVGPVVEELVRLHDEVGCRAPIVAVAREVEARDVRRCLDRGVGGYVTVVDGLGAVEEALRRVAAGELYIGPSAGVALAVDAAAGTAAELSPRELELLRMLALGYTNAEAATELFYSVRTVKADRAGLCRRLGVHRRRDLVRAAIDLGLMRDAAA